MNIRCPITFMSAIEWVIDSIRHSVLIVTRALFNRHQMHMLLHFRAQAFVRNVARHLSGFHWPLIQEVISFIYTSSCRKISSFGPSNLTIHIFQDLFSNLNTSRGGEEWNLVEQATCPHSVGQSVHTATGAGGCKGS